MPLNPRSLLLFTYELSGFAHNLSKEANTFSLDSEPTPELDLHRLLPSPLSIANTILSKWLMHFPHVEVKIFV